MQNSSLKSDKSKATRPQSHSQSAKPLAPRQQQQRRRQHETIPRPQSERQEGIVVSRPAGRKFGFIKAASGEGRYFFHEKDCSAGCADYGTVVSFLLGTDSATNQVIAYDVVTLQERPVSPLADVLCEEQKEGICQEATKETDDSAAAAGGPAPGLGPPLSSVVILPDTPQLGRVTLMKKEFGFIRQVDRPGDVFFHLSNASKMPNGRMNVGDDVTFSLRRDPSGKLSAIDIKPAPPGSVVFDIIEDEVRRGWIVERPNLGRQETTSSGILEFLYLPGDKDSRARLPYSLNEGGVGIASVKPGDHVTFQIAKNVAAEKAAKAASIVAAAVLGGRRAINVTPVLLLGTVRSVVKTRQFGFISYTDDANPLVGAEDVTAAKAAEDVSEEELETEDAAEVEKAASGRNMKSRIFFHFNEVSGGARLHPGDEVAYSIRTNPKSGDMIATRIKVIKIGPRPVEAYIPEKNPNRIKLTGNLSAGNLKAQYVPKMPDGTVGFGVGRGVGLAGEKREPGVPGSNNETMLAALQALKFAGCSQSMIRSASSASLSIEAKPFVPLNGE